MGALPQGLARRDHDLARRAPSLARRQARAPSSALRAWMPVLGTGSVLHKDARAASGRGKCHHAGALSRAAGWGGNALGAPEIRWLRSPATRLDPETPGAQHGSDE